MWSVRDFINSGFRVWFIQDFHARYQDGIYVKTFNPAVIILSTRIPSGVGLKDIDSIQQVELHYDTCGNPSQYLPRRAKYVFEDCRQVFWWVNFGDSFDPQGQKYIELSVSYNYKKLREKNIYE
jgi:hypothetical protein